MKDDGYVICTDCWGMVPAESVDDEGKCKYTYPMPEEGEDDE